MIIGSNPFVGRDLELAELRGRLTGAVRLDVVVVTGEPGIGKSALLRRLADAHPNALWAQATEWEAAVPGAVLAQLLDQDTPADPLAAAGRLAVAATGLLVVDDADNADTASLQALSVLARHHRDLPLLMLLGARTIPALLADLVTGELALTGLDGPAVTALAAARGTVIHPAMGAALTGHTRGNPRAVLTLLDELPASVWAQPDTALPAPSYVVAQVEKQLAHCGCGARSLVEALAILGPAAPLAEVSGLAGLDDPSTAIDEATAAGLVVGGSRFEPRLRDSLARAAVVDLMGVHGASRAHRRAAEIVTDTARRITHRVAAAPLPDAALADEVDVLARTRGAEGAWAQAATLFRDASRLAPDPLVRDERLTRSVDALIAAGDCAGAAAQVPAVESLRETPLRNAVLAYLAIVRGRAAEAEMRLRRADDIVNADRDPDTAALIAQRYVLHSLVRCNGDELVRWADRAVQLVGRNSPAGTEAAAIRGLGLAAMGQFRQATAAYDELASWVRHGAQAQRATMGRGWLQLIRDDIDGARSSLESALATAGLGGSARITLWAHAWLARVQFTTGEWDRALDTVAAGRALTASSGIVLAAPILEWAAAQIYSLRGNWPAAEAAVRNAEAVTQDYEMMRIPTLLAKAHIAEAEADYGKVRRILEPLRTMAPGTSLEIPGHWPWVDVLANAMVIDGHLDAADTFLRPHETRARSHGHRSTLARLGYARGRLLGARGDVPAARRSFEEALRLLDGLPLRFDLARVNFAFGQTLRRAGKRRQADEVISTARDLYLSLGAETYVARCDRELKAGGLHQVQRPRDSVELTPQEEAVSSLVAQGLSNREVAAELYVSPKTVQYHLTRIYAKLGVRSRSELAALRR